MILAQEKYAVNHIKEEKKKGFVKKQKPAKNVLVKTLVIGIIFSIFFLGILLTAQYAKIASTGFEVLQLKQEIASLETANERLYLQALQLRSLNRIEEIAVTKLGMIYAEPSEKQQLAVAYNNKMTELEYAAEKKANFNVILVEQNGRQLNPIIQAISQIIKLR